MGGQRERERERWRRMRVCEEGGLEGANEGSVGAIEHMGAGSTYTWDMYVCICVSMYKHSGLVSVSLVRTWDMFS